MLRDPGVFSSWTTSSVILSKDNFLHVYPWKDTSMDDTSDPQKTAAVTAILFDWSSPVFSININCLETIELPAKNKKDYKIELATKSTKWSGLSLRDIKKEIKSLGLFETEKLEISNKRLEELTKEPKLLEKVALKATSQ